MKKINFVEVNNGVLLNVVILKDLDCWVVCLTYAANQTYREEFASDTEMYNFYEGEK